MALAVGYEFRREEINNPGVPGTFSGDVLGLGLFGWCRVAQHQRGVRGDLRPHPEERRG
jgi:hypothetical protein